MICPVVVIALLHTIVGSNAELLRGIRREHPREQGGGGSRDDTNHESYISRRILKIFRHDFFPSTTPDEEVTVHKHYWPLPPDETPDPITATTTTATTTLPSTTTATTTMPSTTTATQTIASTTAASIATDKITTDYSTTPSGTTISTESTAATSTSTSTQTISDTMASTTAASTATDKIMTDYSSSPSGTTISTESTAATGTSTSTQTISDTVASTTAALTATDATASTTVSDNATSADTSTLSEVGAAISTTEASATTTTEGAMTPSVCHVFVTSQQYSGNLGGIQGGNNKCLELAANASRAPRSGLTWKAWLSTNGYSPQDNFNKCGSYVLVDGSTQVANSWDALTDGSIDNRINQNENGDSIGDINLFYFPAVWTGTSPTGQIADDERTCDNWTRDIIEDFSKVLSLGGAIGDAQRTTGEWTKWGNQFCFLPARLYCFEGPQ